MAVGGDHWLSCLLVKEGDSRGLRRSGHEERVVDFCCRRETETDAQAGGGVFLEEEQSRDTGKMKPGFGRGLGGGGQGSERSRQAWGREDEMGSRGTERC